MQNKQGSRVFIVEEPLSHIDLSTVAEYGRLVTIFPKGARRPPVFKPVEYTQAIFDELRAMGYDSTVDFIALTRTLLPNALMIATVAATVHEFRILMFDASSETYVPKTITSPKV